MNFKSMFVICLGLLVLASPSLAQQDSTGTGGFEFTQPAHRFEIIPMGGYVWTVSKDATYYNVGGEFDMDDSGFWGIAVDINAKPGVQARLLYRRQDTKMTWKQGGSKEDLGNLGVEYWHVGGVVGMQKGKVKPYTSLSLGGTRYVYDDGDDWKFSIILSLGAKVYLNDRIGLMVGGQMPFTFTSTFLGVGSGGLSLGGTGIMQLDLVAGLIIAI